MKEESRDAIAKPIRVGRYELGRTLSVGNLCMVKLARDVITGYPLLIKMLHKQTLLTNHIMDLIDRNLSIMKMIRHPNIVHLYEVKTTDIKLFIVLEHVTGGKLFDQITNSRRLTELEARKYFQQLISAVACCHSKGVSHGNLKPENLLLDAEGVLKVSDFGMNALSQQDQLQQDGKLHTPYTTPHYMAPEVASITGYEGAQADIWSCGVILFVLLAGYLPFNDKDIKILYLKTCQGDFACPSFFSPSVERLIKRILDPSPATRITINEILEDEWFNSSSDKDSKNVVGEGQDVGPAAPVTKNALKKSLGFNLVGKLLNKVLVKRETRFMSKCSANEIISGIEHTVASMGFNVKKRKYKLRIEGEHAGRKGHLSLSTKISEANPPFHTVEIREIGGDTLEFDKFYKDLSAGLQDIIWKEESVNTEKDGASTSGAK